MEYIIHVANVLYLISYLVRDILWLRIITIIAIFCLMPYFYIQPEPLWAAIAWNIVFAIINIYQVYLLWLERRPVYLNSEEEALRERAFSHLSARDFQKLASAGKWKNIEHGTELVSQGQKREKLFVIAEGRADVSVAGETIAILNKGQFIGEMSYMTSELTTASVVTSESGRLLVWSLSDLEKLFTKHGDLRSALQQSIGNDLCKKLGAA